MGPSEGSRTGPAAAAVAAAGAGGRRGRVLPRVRVRTWDTPGPWGSFTFTSQSPGEHEVCLYLKSTRFALFYDGKLAIHLDMQLGEHTNDYMELAANDKLTLLHLRIQQLVEQVEKVQEEQEYQRARLGPVGTADV
ncbi:hypothetical protein AB1E18_005769 [Capra hircus]